MMFNIKRTQVTFNVSSLIFAICLWFPIQGLTTEPDEFDSLPPILNFFPRCEYQVVENVAERKRIKATSYMEGTEELERATMGVLVDLRQRAKSVGADALILTDRKLVTPRKEGGVTKKRKEYVLEYQADLISLCAEDFSAEKQLTSLNSKGNKVNFAFKSTLTERKSVTFKVNTNKYQPPVIKSHIITKEDGMAGLKIGDTQTQLTELLGRFSLHYKLPDGNEVFGYGRHFWVYVNAGIVTKISTFTPFFSKNLTNEIPFDERLDNSLWKFDAGFSIGDSAASVINVLPNLALEKAGSEIYYRESSDLWVFHFENSLSSDDNDNTLVGFSLTSNESPHNISKLESIDEADRQLLSKVIADDADIDVEEIPSIGLLRKSNSMLLILDNHILLEVKDGVVSEILAFEQLVDSDFVKNKSHWTINGVRQNSSKREVKRTLGSFESFYDDEVTTLTEHFEHAYYFEGNGDMASVYEAKLVRRLASD